MTWARASRNSGVKRVGSAVDLVIFDLGRVLIRICDGWLHACEVAGITVDEDVAARLKGPPPAAANELLHRYDTGRIDLPAFAAGLAPLCGLTPEDVVRLQECYLRGPYPGIDGLLDDLAAAGVRTGCLSNTSDLHWRMMRSRGGANSIPLDRLHHCFASHLVGLRKPDDAIYAHVERETGTPGNRIVFFDDVGENVEAARRRGWHGCRIDPAPDDAIPQARQFLLGLGVL